ncbi:MAG: peptidoglycan recognition family protein [Acidobacteriota bacterium]
MFKEFSRPVPDHLEREANRIADPLERLRYLRKHAPATVGAPEPKVVTGPSAFRRGKRQVMAIAAAGIVGAGALVYSTQPQWFRAQADAPKRTVVIPYAGPNAAAVWKVETSETEEVYSNGLRVDLSFATHNRPRAEYPIFAMVGDSQPIAMAREPRGIVFHTTESDIAPFEESETKKIGYLGHMLLRFVRREHSYHYLVDRFGRVYRVVEESDAANHAGFSVWSDDRGVYVNLNDSFIGIAFEGKMENREGITAGQITAARQLTEMLRARYDIRAEDCVTHAQVSVVPQNMHLANHMDWAQGFPWASFNLPDNYKLPVPAVTAFGFEHDEVLTKASGGKDWPGLLAADKKLLEDAAGEPSTEARHRGMLRHRYHEILTGLRQQQQTSAAAQAAEKNSNGGAARNVPANDLGDI